MERVRSAKAASAAPAPKVEEAAPAPAPRRVRPAKPMADPQQRPNYMLDGYGPLARAFRGERVECFYREKHWDDGVAVRLYYVGALLLGSISISPTQVVASFQHSLAESPVAFPTLPKAEAYLRKLLQQVP